MAGDDLQKERQMDWKSKSQHNRREKDFKKSKDKGKIVLLGGKYQQKNLKMKTEMLG